MPLVVGRLIHDHAVHERASVRLVYIPIRVTPLDGTHAWLSPHPVSASSLVVASRPPTFRCLELCKKKRERGYKVQLWDLQKHCFCFSLIVYCFRREICRRVVVVRKLINHCSLGCIALNSLTLPRVNPLHSSAFTDAVFFTQNTADSRKN